MNKRIIFTDRTDSLLDHYLRDITKYKILDYSGINDLVKKAQDGDIDARNKIITSNLRFVVTVAKQFQGRGVPLMDLISSGNLGIVKAINKFDPNRGVTFLSYAVWWIRQSIYSTIYWQGRPIRLPMSQQLLVNSITDAIDKFMKENDRNPSSIEISELTNIPVEQIDFLAQYSNKLTSIDDYINCDEEGLQICDIISDGNAPLDEQLDKSYLSNELKVMVNKLTDREHDLICMLYGIGMPSVNLKTIQDMFGVGGERLRQMKENTLAKIRRKFSKQLKNLM